MNDALSGLRPTPATGGPTPADDPAMVRRLHRLEGQIQGLGRMFEQARPPVELLDQIAAIRGALAGLGIEVVSRELATHVGASRAGTTSDDDPCALARHLLRSV